MAYPRIYMVSKSSSKVNSKRVRSLRIRTRGSEGVGVVFTTGGGRIFLPVSYYLSDAIVNLKRKGVS